MVMRDRQTAHRVAARYRIAEMIGGDLRLTLAKWRDKLDEWSSWEAEIPRIVQEYADGPPPHDPTRKGPSYASYLYFVTHSQHWLQRVGVHGLLLGILQQYALDNVDRLKIEEAARYLGKKGLRDPRSLKTAIPAYRKTLGIYLDWFKTAEQAIKGKLRDTDDNGVSVLSAGKFKVINTGGFDLETMKSVAEVVKHAQQRLTAKGLDKVCYGDILVSQQVHQANWAAFYLYSHDEMFVRADLQGKADPLHTVIHELGHRLQGQFLKTKQRQIALMYGKIKRGRKAQTEAAIEAIVSDPANHPKEGERTRELTSGRWWLVTSVKQGYRSSWTVNLRAEEDPKITGRMDLWDYLRQQKNTKLPPIKATDFVTDYASTQAAENFAEMIAFYCLDKLPEDQLEMLLPIIS